MVPFIVVAMSSPPSFTDLPAALRAVLPGRTGHSSPSKSYRSSQLHEYPGILVPHHHAIIPHPRMENPEVSVDGP
jgi:hypothetical protein